MSWTINLSKLWGKKTKHIVKLYWYKICEGLLYRRVRTQDIYFITSHTTLFGLVRRSKKLLLPHILETFLLYYLYRGIELMVH